MEWMSNVIYRKYSWQQIKLVFYGQYTSLMSIFPIFQFLYDSRKPTARCFRVCSNHSIYVQFILLRDMLDICSKWWIDRTKFNSMKSRKNLMNIRNEIYIHLFHHNSHNQHIRKRRRLKFNLHSITEDDSLW
jgi:hypothetical protein